MFFRKHILPWTSRDCFESEAEFTAWLQKKHKLFSDLRIIFILIAAVPLIVGYIMDLRPLMLVTIAPLLIVLAASAGLDQIEKLFPEPEPEEESEETKDE